MPIEHSQRGGQDSGLVGAEELRATPWVVLRPVDDVEPHGPHIGALFGMQAEEHRLRRGFVTDVHCHDPAKTVLAHRIPARRVDL